jgi:hypothetical protein
MLLVSATFLATACGPQVEPDDMPATTGAALEDDSAEAKRPKCNNQPGATFVSRDPQECIAITFTCPEGQQGFFNECGCGCEPIP